MTQEITLRSQQVESLLARFKDGDLSARDELLQATCERFNYMARAMKRDFPKVGRWEQTEDIVQNASLRLCRALELFFAVPDSGVREGLKVWSVPRLHHHPLRHRARC